MSTATMTWSELNQRYLTAALAQVRGLLSGQAALNPGRKDNLQTDNLSLELQNLQAEMISPPTVEIVCETFHLSEFERHILLLCAGTEMDSAFSGLLASLAGDSRRAYPTFSLALSIFPGAHWNALSPAGPLRYWRLIEVTNGINLTASQLKIDECILHYLAGLEYLDERLEGFIRSLPRADNLVGSHREISRQAVTAWSQEISPEKQPVLQFFGSDKDSQKAIADTVCSQLSLNLQSISFQVVPPDTRELEALIRLWERKAALTRGALLLDITQQDSADRNREGAISRLLEELQSPVILIARQRRSIYERNSITFEIQKPTADEQRSLWQETLGTASPNSQVESLVSQFNLNAAAIYSISEEALKRRESSRGDGNFEMLLWNTCRASVQPRMDELAQHITSRALWADLVLPEMPKQVLSEIVIHVRQRRKVYETWGFGSRHSRGLGITALFAGPSGTGKTLAAEVLANELRLDLYRIDLSQVVSKYIGETEKNLRRVFDAVEDSGAILLFDEADALFGKRSEVKDSHDRYANIEISYLLQRMESYRGLAILTTNMKEAMDSAFLRRIRFVVKFPFPNTEQRIEIWRRIFPRATPTQGLNIEKLAQLNVSGGNIKNMALYAAFLAAEKGEPVGMQHLLQAARAEYSKLEKALTETEIRGWL